MGRPAEHTCSTTVKKARNLPLAQKQRQLESHRAASARYRERNREKVLAAGRKRAAEYVSLLTVSPGTGSTVDVDNRRRAKEKNDEQARECARLASARYRAHNHEELALQQRLVRKRAFIKKHGVHAYIQRRFDAPMRSAAVSTSEDGDSGAEAPAVSTSDDVHVDAEVVDAEAEAAQVLRHFYESEHPFSPHR